MVPNGSCIKLRPFFLWIRPKSSSLPPPAGVGPGSCNPSSSQSLRGLSGSHPGSSSPFTHVPHEDSFLPYGHCWTRTTKDKIRAGAWVMPQFPSHSHRIREGAPGSRRALVPTGACPEPGAGFILGIPQRKPNWNETKGRATPTPAQAPTRGPKAKEQPRNQSKGPKEGGEFAHSRGWRRKAKRGRGRRSWKPRDGRVQASAAPALPVPHPSARG